MAGGALGTFELVGGGDVLKIVSSDYTVDARQP
jgi:hypothetical protein